jgi:hypothetical protein
MPEEELRRAARALVHLAAGWRDRDDLETLARLPDGTAALDLLAGAVRHDSGAEISLRLAAALREDLAARLSRRGVPAGAVREAVLILRADTGAILTDRERIVHFDFDLEARLRGADGGEISESRREAHVWHARDGD